MRTRTLAVVLLIVIAAAWQLRAPARLASPAADAAAVATTGLTLQLDAAGATDARLVRLPALAVKRGDAASPFLKPGPFRATFRGAINLKLRDEVIFTAAGRGTLTLKVADQVVLDSSGDLSSKKSEPVRLRRGPNPIELTYTPPDGGDAELRLLWLAGGSPIPEPIPPELLTPTSPAADELLAKQSQLREGRSLVASMNCWACHATDPLDANRAMPELSHRLPTLDNVGQRFTREYLARWIDHPQALRAGTPMPRLFTDGAGGAPSPSAVDVAAFLADRDGDPPSSTLKFADAQVEQGTRLFVSHGCVACHTAPDAAPDVDARGRVSLNFGRAKWRTPEALVAYLKDPHAAYPDNPMPNLKLTDAEASAVAGYVWAKSPADSVAAVDFANASADRGRGIYNESCVACHATGGSPGQTPLAELKALDRGCLASDPAARGAAPLFELTDAQRAAIRAVLTAAPASIAAPELADEFVSRAMSALRCNACHAIDGAPSTWDAVADEAAALVAPLGPAGRGPEGDQSRPTLTWAGDRLRVDWMSSFIAGRYDPSHGRPGGKPRPWLEPRMPAYPDAIASRLARGLAAAHGWTDSPVVPAKPAPEKVDLGRALVQKDGGFSCVQCHAVNDTPALAPFEAPAPNFALTRERLRDEFYLRWMFNPQHYQPGTRMPQFADADAKTALKDKLDGDARAQFEAVWAYIQSLGR